MENYADVLNAWLCVVRIATAEDNITVYAAEVPETQIPIQLEVIR